MSSYRFCRTDDMQLLADAYNACYRPHFDDLPEMTVDRFKGLIRELDLWCSSCMVASDEAGRPIGVLLAAKRETESLIWAVGAHPEHLRRGHCRHLMTSLGSKLAILGPPRMLAEVPADLPAARSLFEACGYEREAVFRDLVLDPRAVAGRAVDPGMVVPLGMEQVRESGALDPAAPRCWRRSLATLANLGDAVQGLALASDRIEAWVLWRADPERAGANELLGLGEAEPAHGGALLAALLGHLIERWPSGWRLRGAGPADPAVERLRAWGFREDREHVRYAATAGSA